MLVYSYINLHIHTYICANVNTLAYMFTKLYVKTYIHTYIYFHVRVYTCIRKFLQKYIIHVHIGLKHKFYIILRRHIRDISTFYALVCTLIRIMFLFKKIIPSSFWMVCHLKNICDELLLTVLIRICRAYHYIIIIQCK